MKQEKKRKEDLLALKTELDKNDLDAVSGGGLGGPKGDHSKAYEGDLKKVKKKK